MEDIKQPQQPSPPPVMDIQPPQPNPGDQAVPNFAPEGQVATAPTESPETTVPNTENTTEATPVLATPTPAHKSHRVPMVAVLCAVIFTGIFAAVAAVAYMSKSDVKSTDTSQQSTDGTTGEAPATATDVSDTDKAIDENLSSMDDANDYNDAGVSDTTLGL